MCRASASPAPGAGRRAPRDCPSAPRRACCRRRRHRRALAGRRRGFHAFHGRPGRPGRPIPGRRRRDLSRSGRSSPRRRALLRSAGSARVQARVPVPRGRCRRARVCVHVRLRCWAANSNRPPEVLAEQGRRGWGWVRDPDQVVSSLLPRLMHGNQSSPHPSLDAPAPALRGARVRGKSGACKLATVSNQLWSRRRVTVSKNVVTIKLALSLTRYSSRRWQAYLK